jgi:hypothetical protein
MLPIGRETGLHLPWENTLPQPATDRTDRPMQSDLKPNGDNSAKQVSFSDFKAIQGLYAMLPLGRETGLHLDWDNSLPQRDIDRTDRAVQGGIKTNSDNSGSSTKAS